MTSPPVSFLDEEYIAHNRKVLSLTDKQENQFKELQELVQAHLEQREASVKEHCVSEQCLLRFLKFHKHKAKKAFAAWKDMLIWRDENKVDDILHCPPTSVIERLRHIHPEVIDGHDKAGMPVLYLRIGRFVSKEIAATVTLDEYARYHAFIMESVLQFARENGSHGRLGERLTMVVDCDQLHSTMRQSNIRRYFPYFKRIVEIDEKYYPEVPYKILIVNNPRVFDVIWALVRGWVSTALQEKVHILGSNYEDQVKAVIPVEKLLSTYGGASPPPPTFRLPKAVEADPNRKLTVVDVAARDAYTHDVTVSNDDLAGKHAVIIEYYFETVGKDIKFRVELTPDGSDDKSTLIKEAKCRSHLHAVWGEVACAKAGVVTLTWSNEYSYFTAKELKFQVSVNTEADHPLASDPNLFLSQQFE